MVVFFFIFRTQVFRLWSMGPYLCHSQAILKHRIVFFLVVHAFKNIARVETIFNSPESTHPQHEIWHKQ